MYLLFRYFIYMTDLTVPNVRCVVVQVVVPECALEILGA